MESCPNSLAIKEMQIKVRISSFFFSSLIKLEKGKTVDTAQHYSNAREMSTFLERDLE